MVYTRETTEMKKIINNPNAVVEEMLQGIEIANPDVLYDREGVVIARKEKVIRSGLYPEEAAVMNRRMPAMSAMVCWMPQ